MKEKIGTIGLGIMGRPAAINLLRAGYSVGVWARRQNSVDALVVAGATVYKSIQALAAASDVVITNVSDTPDVEAITIGEQGIKSALRSGGMVIDMSTIAPAAAIEIAAQLARVNIDFLDAPVSGGERGAMDGTLSFMVGGQVAAFERALPIFMAMGKTVTHVGASGAGQIAKACNQIIIGATISAVAEAFQLAQVNQVDRSKVRQALLGGFAASRVLEIHAKRMIDADYSPGFKAILHKKDIDIALTEADKQGLRLPSAILFQQRLQRLIAADGGELDSAAITTVIEAELTS